MKERTIWHNQNRLEPYRNMDKTDRELFDAITGSIKKELEQRGRKLEKRHGSSKFKYTLMGTAVGVVAIAGLGVINPFVGAGMFVGLTFYLAKTLP